MFSIFLPLYEQSPRDMAGTQWRPVRLRSPNVTSGGNFIAEARVFFDVPGDECWLLDSVLLAAVGSVAIVGPPSSPEARITARILTMEDVLPPGVPNNALTRIVTLVNDRTAGPAPGVQMTLRLGQLLFVPPSTRLMFTTFFDADNPNNVVNMNLSGLAFPRGNLSK